MKKEMCLSGKRPVRRLSLSAFVTVAHATLLATLCALAVPLAASAKTGTWIGGDGNWGTANNWQDGVVPNAVGDVAVFPIAQDVTVTLDGKKTVGRIEVSGAMLTLSGNSLALADSSGVAVVDVDDGAKLTNRCVVVTDSGNASSIEKTGAGDWFQGDFMNTSPQVTGIDVRQGTFNTTFGKDSDGLKMNGNGWIRIRSGAKMKTWLSNQVENYTVYTIDAGGVLDGNGYGDAIGAFEGSGVITNVGSFNLNREALAKREYVFSGKMYGGTLTIPLPSDPSTGFTLANPDAFSSVTVKATAPETLTEPVPLFRLAEGVGDYSTRYIYIATNPFHRVYIPVEDVAGNPLTATMNFRHQGGSAFQGTMQRTHVRGAGTLVHKGYAYTVTNGLVTGGASLVAGHDPEAAGEVIIGAKTVQSDPDMTEIGSLGVTSSATLVLSTSTAMDVTNNVFANGGTVSMLSPGEWRFRDLNLTNATLKVSSNVVTKVTVDGGVSHAAKFLPNYDTVDLTVNGGELWATNEAFWGIANRTLHVNGGIAAFGPVSGYADSFSAKPNQEVYIYMTGGKLYSWTYYNYGRGVGADLSGDAEMVLRIGKDNFQPHRIGSDGRAHTIRLRDNAVLDVDRLNFTSSNSDSYLILEGGEFRVTGDVYTSSSGGGFKFDGGRVVSVRDSDATWNQESKQTGWVLAGGMKVHVPRTYPSSGLNWNGLPIVSGVDGAVDGGLEKTGAGYLALNSVASYTGPTVVRGGYLVSSASTAAPYGTGSVSIDNARISQPSSVAVTQTLASAVGASLSFAGGAVISLDNVSGNAGFVVGAPGAVAGAALARVGHGILALQTSADGKKAGIDAGFRVNGAVNDAATGLLAQPVFGYDKALDAGQFSVGNVWRVLRFMTADSEGNLTPAATEDGIVNGAGNVCRISSSKVTVSSNTHIGAIDLSYETGTTTGNSTCLNGLTISSGVTLTVGNGAGSLGMVLLNNMPLLYCNRKEQSFQSIRGGTLAFGAAEGLIVCNQTFSYYTQETEPAEISSAITGTGGLTLASPTRPQGYPRVVRLSGANTYTGGTWIEGTMVQPGSATAFGAGTEVYVEGGEADGGGVEFVSSSPATFSYNLHLAGRGTFWYDDIARRIYSVQGAIRARRDVSVTGTVALSGLVRVCADIGKTLVFSAAVSGDGSLEKGGAGTVRLSAANAYTDGTVVEEGILEVGDAGTLGLGPVEVKRDAVLRFVNASPKTVTNKITGEGRIEFAGAGSVSLADADGFTGIYGGMLSNAAGDGTVEIDAAEGYNAEASQSGDFGIVKTGAGEMSLTGANTYTGATVVAEGTLALGRPVRMSAPLVEDLSIRLDASDTNTMTLVEANGTNFVSQWRDADGRSVTFTTASAAVRPALSTNAINGLSTVWFAGNLNQRLHNNSTAHDVGTVFVVARTANNGSSHPNGSGWSCIGLVGTYQRDVGMRVSSKALQKDGWMINGAYRVDGTAVDTATIPFGPPFVATGRPCARVHTDSIAVGDYWANTTYKRGWYGDIAEVLIYKRRLSEEEIVLVEAYLQGKWTPDALATVPDTAADVLPSGGDVVVADGAALDLFGTVETVSSLDCAGDIVNTSEQKATLTVTGDSVLGGAIGANIELHVTGGTLTILPGATLPPDITIHLEAGATIDLSGQTIGIRRIYRDGIVVNGAFLQSDPVRGMTIIMR